jgi:hypothetical protein
MITTATRQQYFTAVAQLGDLDLVYQAISADTESAAWIQFNSAELLQLGDAVAQATQLALGFTEDQMATLFDTAAKITV